MRKTLPALRPWIEVLEARALPSVSPVITESFDQTPAGSLPPGWSQWSNTASSSFSVQRGRGVGDTPGLVTTGPSNARARAWQGTSLPADIQASAAIYLDSLVPVQLFGRGSKLDSDTPSYYALSINRGLQVQLQRVANGVTTTLGAVKSSAYFSGQWVRASLNLSGSKLEVQVYRPDTGQYLNASGQWQATATWALQKADTTLTGGGQVGFGRADSYFGGVTVDDYKVTASTPQPGPGPAKQETFDTVPSGLLPTGWAQWSNSGARMFGASTARPLSGSKSLAGSGASNISGRAWQTAPHAADTQASAAIYLDSLSPAQVFVRGSKLDTANASYYAASITRGLRLELQRVVNGTTETLGILRSMEYFSGRWVRMTLAVNGSSLKVQVVRTDTGQYLNSGGRWQSAAAWAMEKTDGTIKEGALAGVARAGGYASSVFFDDFAVSTTSTPPSNNQVREESFDSTPVGSLPTTWSQWSNTGTKSFAVSTTRKLSGRASLASSGASNVAARAWLGSSLPADLEASAAVYADSLVPVQVFARGSKLDTANPSYYAVSLTRGLQVQVLRVANGTTTVLGSVNSSDYVSGRWVQVTLAVRGSSIRGQVYRPDSNEYLNSSGQWQPAPVWVIDRTDSGITGGGMAGVARGMSYSGTVYVDDFAVVG